MSMDYVRKHYKVPAKRGGRIRWQRSPGKGDVYTGTIVGARFQYLRVRLDFPAQVVTLHPTDGIEYLPAEAKG